jgi:periplasmic divalent cation tolerance protein
MGKREIIWVTVSTTSRKQAEKIGMAVLKKRLCACFSLLPKITSVYFWPPKTGRLEKSKGPLLILETLEKNYSKIVKEVKALHTEKVPFIGQWEMENVDKNFYNWLKLEIK